MDDLRTQSSGTLAAQLYRDFNLLDEQSALEGLEALSELTTPESKEEHAGSCNFIKSDREQSGASSGIQCSELG